MCSFGKGTCHYRKKQTYGYKSRERRQMCRTMAHLQSIPFASEHINSFWGNKQLINSPFPLPFYLPTYFFLTECRECSAHIYTANLSFFLKDSLPACILLPRSPQNNLAAVREAATMKSCFCKLVFVSSSSSRFTDSGCISWDFSFGRTVSLNTVLLDKTNTTLYFQQF